MEVGSFTASVIEAPAFAKLAPEGIRRAWRRDRSFAVAAADDSCSARARRAGIASPIECSGLANYPRCKSGRAKGWSWPNVRHAGTRQAIR